MALVHVTEMPDKALLVREFNLHWELSDQQGLVTLVKKTILRFSYRLFANVFSTVFV